VNERLGLAAGPPSSSKSKDRSMPDATSQLPAGTSLQRTVRMEARLNAPPERVQRAWADPEELARWFPDRVEGAIAVGARTMLVWQNHRVWWDVIESRAGERFSFRWPWGADEQLVTTVLVTFSPAGYGTALELEDGQFPLDAPGGLDAWAEAIEGWSQALAMLRAYLDFSVDLRERP
jgi:uncharacterized protein YndB with AHSA1/START domain